MSFLTEYFDEYRQHPIRKNRILRPEMFWAKLEGKFKDSQASHTHTFSDADIKKFIKETMSELRGQSTYYNDYCANIPPDIKKRCEDKDWEPVPHKRKRPCKKDKVSSQETGEKPVKPGQPSDQVGPTQPAAPKLAMKDTELMKLAKAIYERDLDKPSLRPLDTHGRILGYTRARFYHTGLSEYQDGIGRVAYELVRDERIPRFVAANGARPTWGYPPDDRQPMLDAVPYDGERLY